MLKKSLLASVALFSLNITQAHQAHETMSPQHPQMHPHDAAPHSNCPPCGGVSGWVLLPAGPGMPCNQGMSQEKSEEANLPHQEPITEAVEPHHPEHPGKHGMHPPRTNEQEQLENELQPVKPHIYLRANPDSPNPTKKEGEWGKVLNNKVYFRHLGNWVYDPSVNAATDIITTGVKAKTQALEEALKRQHQPQQRLTARPAPRMRPAPPQVQPPVEASKSNPAEATNSTEPANSVGTSEASSVPPPPSGAPKRSGRKAWPKVNVPDALGTTNRANLVRTEPTQNNERQFGLGSPNRAQTGVTGDAPPQIDASGAPATP